MSVHRSSKVPSLLDVDYSKSWMLDDRVSGHAHGARNLSMMLNISRSLVGTIRSGGGGGFDGE